VKVPSFVRRVTDPLLGAVRLPVLSGVNRGRSWSLISAGSGYVSGRRARAQMDLLISLVRPGDVIWDVGAHHGYVTLAAARAVGPAGFVHAFEPSMLNRTILERHVRWNRLTNVAVHPFALSDHDGEARFGGTGTSKMFALDAGSELVQVRTAGTLVRDGTCRVPTFVKIDVEGAEGVALAGLMPVLAPTARLVIAVHGPEADRQCDALLTVARFERVPSHALVASRAGSWASDPDLYCAGPAWEKRDEDRALLRAAGF
jgi:FkbM family methyltransferase